MARGWNRLALAVAHKTGHGRPECLDSNGDGPQAGGAIPNSVLWRSDRSRANHLVGSRPAGFGRVHSDPPSGSRCMASSRDWILPDRSQRPRSLRTAEGRSLVGVIHDARSSLRGHQGRASASQTQALSFVFHNCGTGESNIRVGRERVADLSGYVDVANERSRKLPLRWNFPLQQSVPASSQELRRA
jgi:hypothetical protein